MWPWFSARFPITRQRYDKSRRQSYDSVRYDTILYDSTCYLAARAFWRFAQVRRCEPCLAWGEPLGGFVVAVAHAVGHLHLGHVEVLGACAQFRGLLLVVLSEVAAESSSCCHDSWPFPAPPICHQIAHHAVHFLPFLVWTHEFGSTCVRFQEREKYWNDGLVHVFWDFFIEKQHIFRASAQILHAWRGGFADVILHFCLACLIRWCDINCWLSAFERENRREKIPVVTIVTVVTIKFQGMTIPSLFIYIYLIYK